MAQRYNNPEMEKRKKKTLKEALDVAESLKDNPAVSALILFGSHVTGKNKPSSDVDLAVILKDINKETEAEIGSTYSQDIDLVLFHRLPLYIQYEVFKDGKPLYVKDEKLLKETKYQVLREYHDMQYHYQKRKQSMKTYKIDRLANWYYGNVCMKCGRMDNEDGRTCYDRLHSLKNELPGEMTHREYVKYVKNKEGICRPVPRTFHECPTCKALGVPVYRG